MIKSLWKILSIFAIVNILVIPCYAEERMPAGTVLAEESYVFSIEEAQNLRGLIVELQNEVQKQKDLVAEHKRLEIVLGKEIETLSAGIELRDARIAKLEEWRELDYSRISKLERQRKADKFEKWGFLGLGAAITLGGILLGDKVGDFAETN